MKKIIKKIKQPTISILAFAVGLIVCVSFSSAETQIRYVSDELADEGSGEDSKNLIEKFGDQIRWVPTDHMLVDCMTKMMPPYMMLQYLKTGE